MRLSHSLQSSLANFVSINKCCLFQQSKDVYDSDTAILHGIISKNDKTMPSFNPRTFPMLRHINKSGLKTLFFSNNESLSKCFSRALLRFFNISYNSSEL